MNEQRLLELQDRILAKLQDAACQPVEILLEFSRELAIADADFCANLCLPCYAANPEQAESLIEERLKALADRLGDATQELCVASGIYSDHLERVVRTAAGQAFLGRMHAIANAMASADVGSVQ
ncbi:hypothetical protein [Methylobacterium frigidaeris]|uniref:Uncharacterized protein n=1 Tax=Methylobacterium frigidaeris TaxID=2038277 RepID=A0AA37HE85_9HYPH|nr:hypothetical protein [Methylobacterium frigidaeris]PIK73775.1 hypothetical protein CS379_06470 [Methylobacterium frigidaeris]GJD64422.1 hypothetical protein MPEAHAMD_4604 [Methylobacterium frigidaeris]